MLIEGEDYILSKKDGIVFDKNEKTLVDDIIKYTLSLNNNFTINEKKYYYGVVYKDNIFNFVWISRNKKTNKLYKQKKRPK